MSGDMDRRRGSRSGTISSHDAQPSPASTRSTLHQQAPVSPISSRSLTTSDGVTSRYSLESSAPQQARPPQQRRRSLFRRIALDPLASRLGYQPKPTPTLSLPYGNTPHAHLGHLPRLDIPEVAGESSRYEMRADQDPIELPRRRPLEAGDENRPIRHAGGSERFEAPGQAPHSELVDLQSLPQPPSSAHLGRRRAAAESYYGVLIPPDLRRNSPDSRRSSTSKSRHSQSPSRRQKE